VVLPFRRVSSGFERGIGDPRIRVAALDAARAAGELARGRRRAVEDLGDLHEPDREKIVQHEREPLGRVELLKDDEQRAADGVGGERFALGVGRPVIGAPDDRVGEPAGVQRLLSGDAGARRASSDTPARRRSSVSRPCRPRRRCLRGDAKPRLLEGVVGLRGRTEDPGGHGVQVGSVGFEGVHGAVTSSRSDRSRG
jgi:hypothetical protein